MQEQFNIEEKKLYTPEEVANLFNKNILTIYRWIKQKKLETIKMNHQYLIKGSDLKAFLQ